MNKANFFKDQSLKIRNLGKGNINETICSLCAVSVGMLELLLPMEFRNRLEDSPLVRISLHTISALVMADAQARFAWI